VVSRLHSEDLRFYRGISGSSVRTTGRAVGPLSHFNWSYLKFSRNFIGNQRGVGFLLLKKPVNH